MKINNNFSKQNFGTLKSTLGALTRLAELTQNPDSRTQKAYSHLLRLANQDDNDIMIKTYKDTGAYISKIYTQSGDTIEISRSEDFTKAIQDAVEILEEKEKDNITLQNECDFARQRIMMNMINSDKN